MSRKKLIIGGDSAFAEVAYEMFTVESDYEVVAFAVEREFLKRDSLFDLPVVAHEDLPSLYAPADHSFYAATVYTLGNKLRARLYATLKEMGYAPASFISPRAMVWRNVKLGEHVFIFENNVVQPFAEIGDNVVLWSGNHIGHHSRIGSHCFISSHVVISGFCTVGEYTFMGVNATMGNNVNVGKKCTVGAAALILADVPDSRVAVGMWKGPAKS